MELRLQIKQWERDFEKSNGRKPQKDDIKADKHVYNLYKRYKKEKQAPAPASPPPPESPASAPATPEPQPVEILPTPQLGGRTLGLFDLKLTPVKTPQRQQMEAATPKSRRTPSYLRQRDSPMKSPMRARRRYKSISELSSKFEDEAPTMSLDEIARFSLVAEQQAADENSKPEIEAQDRSSRTKPKKRMAVVRPVQETDVPVSTKAGENYQRLTIQKRGFKGKRRG